MKKIYAPLLILAFLCLIGSLKAQDMLSINDLNYGKESINPAYISGDSSSFKITTIIGTANAVENFNKFHFLAHGNIGKLGLGFGVKVNTAFYQVFQVNTSEIMIAKQINLGNSHRLSFGLNTGIALFRLRAENINQYTDMSDPIIQDELYNKANFTTGFGWRYNWKDKVDLSASLPVVVQSKRGLMPIYFTTLAYKQAIGAKMSIEPGLMLYGTNYTKPSFEGNLTLRYQQIAWLKIGGRSTKNFSVGAGANINFLEIAYTYNNIMGEGFQQVYNNLHAIKVSFLFIGNQSIKAKKQEK